MQKDIFGVGVQLFCAAAFERTGGREATSWQSAHNFNLVVLGNGDGLMAQT